MNHPDFLKYEAAIIASRGRDKTFIQATKYLAQEYKHKIDYIMTRFIDDFGTFIDVECRSNATYLKFKKIKTEQYAEVTRFLRFIQYYENMYA